MHRGDEGDDRVVGVARLTQELAQPGDAPGIEPVERAISRQDAGDGSLHCGARLPGPGAARGLDPRIVLHPAGLEPLGREAVGGGEPRRQRARRRVHRLPAEEIGRERGIGLAGQLGEESAECPAERQRPVQSDTPLQQLRLQPDDEHLTRAGRGGPEEAADGDQVLGRGSVHREVERRSHAGGGEAGRIEGLGAGGPEHDEPRRGGLRPVEPGLEVAIGGDGRGEEARPEATEGIHQQREQRDRGQQQCEGPGEGAQEGGIARRGLRRGVRMGHRAAS